MTSLPLSARPNAASNRTSPSRQNAVAAQSVIHSIVRLVHLAIIIIAQRNPSRHRVTRKRSQFHRGAKFKFTRRTRRNRQSASHRLNDLAIVALDREIAHDGINARLTRLPEPGIFRGMIKLLHRGVKRFTNCPKMHASSFNQNHLLITHHHHC